MILKHFYEQGLKHFLITTYPKKAMVHVKVKHYLFNKRKLKKLLDQYKLMSSCYEVCKFTFMEWISRYLRLYIMKYKKYHRKHVIFN